MPDGYAVDDLRWELSRYVKARQELACADLILLDETESVLMITRWFKHNPPMSESHFIGICRLLERLPSQMIWEAASQAAKEVWEEVQAKKLAKYDKSGKAPQNVSNGLQAVPPSKALIDLVGRDTR